MWRPAPGQWGQAQPGWERPVAGPPQPYGAPVPYQSAPGFPPPPPSAGGSPLKLVLLGLIAAIAVGFFAFALVSFLNRPSEPLQPQPTESATPAPEPTPSASTPEPTPAPTVTEPTPTPTPEPTPTGPVYDPPPVPFPQTWEEADQWVLANALYAESVEVPTDCALGRLDLASSDIPQLEAHLDRLIDCTVVVWQGPMERAGFVLPRPPVTVYTKPLTTACGVLETHNAYYCSLDQRLYFATDFQEVLVYTKVDDVVLAAETIMGHEFGHFIQGRSGLWGAYAAFRQRAETEAEVLELSRRIEVQADCLSGMFLNSVAEASALTEDDRLDILRLAEAIGDDTLSGQPDRVGDHGKGATRRHWMETGLGTDQAGQCNTWSVPSERVG